MPKYVYKCQKCGKSTEKYASVKCKTIDCECGEQMKRQMPKLRGLKTTETVDKYTNKKHVTDHKQVLDERKLDYYWSVEVPKMVNSGTYSIETMLEQNWVYYNEKGELVTRTKPPQKS